MFRLFLTKQASRQYEKLSFSDKSKINRIFERLKTDPFVFSKKLRGEFEGLFAVRAWPYRITFTVDKKKIYIVSIIHRQSVYKK